ncbi:MAG: RsmB/NOP family class I SAM-dependent RNA methyltransferase, partial [Polyangiaceae bacterium]
APWLLDQIAPFAPRGIGTIDAHVRACLVVAAYQMFFTRIPAFAAVSEAVDAVRAARGPRLAKFANAVLRKVAERANRAGDAEREEAIVSSSPPWLRDALSRSLSPEGAAAFLRSGAVPPALAIRVERGSERESWLARLRDAAPEASFELGRWSPLAILARGAGKPERLPGWSEGAWSVQEEGSQLAALAVGARPGESVLDACAGRGNKGALLARIVLGGGASGAVDACDLSLAKLGRLGEEWGRLGLRARASFAVDWTAGSGDVTGVYDRVLVDAPCSGVGTLRRRPEIAQRRSSGGIEEITALARVQIAIATRAAEHLRSGGVLVYVVCSVLHEEGQDVVDAVLQARPELSLTEFDPSGPPVLRELIGGRGLLLPHVHGTDGYFVARMVKR